MPIKSEIIDVATDWSLDGSDFKAAIGKAIMALDDATQSLEAQNDDDLADAISDIAKQLYHIADEQED